MEGHEKFADDFQMAMTYYTKQSLMGGDVELQDAYDWRSAKARCCLALPMLACVPCAAWPPLFRPAVELHASLPRMATKEGANWQGRKSMLC